MQLELPGGTAELYLTAHLVQVLALGNESLMNREGKQGGAVPADLIAEVLASHADLWGAGESAEGNRTRLPAAPPWIGQIFLFTNKRLNQPVNCSLPN